MPPAEFRKCRVTGIDKELKRKMRQRCPEQNDLPQVTIVHTPNDKAP